MGLRFYPIFINFRWFQCMKTNFAIRFEERSWKNCMSKMTIFMTFAVYNNIKHQFSLITSFMGWRHGWWIKTFFNYSQLAETLSKKNLCSQPMKKVWKKNSFFQCSTPEKQHFVYINIAIYQNLCSPSDRRFESRRLQTFSKFWGKNQLFVRSHFRL